MVVDEIFYSLQGEGRNTGTPSVFVRFAGCNLHCDFCDTQHQSAQQLAEDEIVDRVLAYPATNVVITGGEPSLQLTLSLVEKLHQAGRKVCMETNGTRPLGEALASAIDWITLSPKFEFCPNAQVRIERFDELKVVYRGQDMSIYDSLIPAHADCCYIQPCDTGEASSTRANLRAAIQFVLDNPRWRLSLQTHKLLGIR